MGFFKEGVTPEQKKRSIRILVAIFVVVIVVSVVIGAAIGLASQGKAAPVTRVIISVEYDGQWTGTYGDIGSMQTWDGEGSNFVYFTRSSTSDAYAVVANAQKADWGSGTLTLKIMTEDHVILKQSSTSSAFGFAQISWAP